MKKILIYVISLLFVFGFRFVPPAAGMTASGMQVLGVFIGTLIMWLTTAIDWPSILCLAGLSLVPELSMNSILASSFGNATFTFLLFTFICTYALSKTSFVKRCAVAFISNRIAQKGSWWFVTLYCLSILIIGLFISPVVLFVVYLPILDTICHELGLTGEDKLANCLALGQMLCCCFSCGMTPIAHVFAVMAIGFYQQATGNVISYAQYMTAAIPVGIICFIVMMLVFRKEQQPVSADVFTTVEDYFPTVMLLAVVVTLIIASFIPGKPDITNGVICCIIALICIIRNAVHYQSFQDSAHALKSVDLQTIILLASLFIVIAGIRNVGVIDDVAGWIADVGGNNLFLLYSIIVWGSVAISAFIDNIPYVATMLPVIQGVAAAMNIEPYLLYFGLLSGATLGGNLTPVGASANITAIGILFKDGHDVSMKEFARIGIPFTLVAVTAGYLFIWFVWR
jgi:Na+/H+ antiporter NhaD/arsenite permease-like protein